MEPGVLMPDFLRGLLPHGACHTARCSMSSVWLDPLSGEGERRELDTDTVALFHILMDKHH